MPTWVDGKAIIYGKILTVEFPLSAETHHCFHALFRRRPVKVGAGENRANFGMGKIKSVEIPRQDRCLNGACRNTSNVVVEIRQSNYPRKASRAKWSKTALIRPFTHAELLAFCLSNPRPLKRYFSSRRPRLPVSES